jgi:creatinine amidohydrolase/Fe(II)-dependent formamide hydrolase-like protein
MSMRKLLVTILLISVTPISSFAQVLKVAELSARDLQNLDRNSTVVVMPGGILEEHGPYLPAFTDGYLNAWLADRTAEAIIADRGGTVLMFPTIPLGAGLPEDLGGLSPFSGSYTVRPETLRSVYMDLASALGDDGFRKIFVISRHGAPHHNSALLEAADYFNDRYDGTMVILTSLVYDGTSETPRILNSEEQTEHGLIAHAGAEETSQTLFLQPKLVAEDYVEAKPFPAATTNDLNQIAKSPDWLGYFGSPRLATPAKGAAMVEYRSGQMIELALRILDGYDWTTLPTRADRGASDPAFRELRNNTDARAEREQLYQDEWIKTRDQ